ncbi:MAG: tRNA (adenine-N1)-methyltransferase [Acidimicrobiales bacterium]
MDDPVPIEAKSGLPPEARGRPFAEHERVLLVDRKGRRNLVRLRGGRSFQSHSGVISHDSLIGLAEGSEVLALTRDADRRNPAKYLALRPTLADVVLNMPRGAQVIYPKDLGAILLAADIFPGARVLESGVGSGALSMTLLRAGAIVTGYELRADFAERARANVAAFLAGASTGNGPGGPPADGQDGQATPGYEVEIRDAYDGIEGTFDRVLLDLPEPWRVVAHAERVVLPGGIFCAYLPSINQTAELRETLARSGFGLAETFEILRRTWHIEGRSIRPDLRMVGHTGFITTARLLGDKLTFRPDPTAEEESGSGDEISRPPL